MWLQVQLATQRPNYECPGHLRVTRIVFLPRNAIYGNNIRPYILSAKVKIDIQTKQKKSSSKKMGCVQFF